MRREFFRNPWNIFELIVLLGDWVVTSLYIVQAVLTSWTLDEFHANKREVFNSAEDCFFHKNCNFDVAFVIE